MASSSVSEVSEAAIYSPFDPDGGGEGGAAATALTGNAGMRLHHRDCQGICLLRFHFSCFILLVLLSITLRKRLYRAGLSICR